MYDMSMKDPTCLCSKAVALKSRADKASSVADKHATSYLVEVCVLACQEKEDSNLKEAPQESQYHR